MGKYKEPPVFAMYKGDELLAFGTVEELMEQTGLRYNTIYYYMSPSYLKKRRGNNFKFVMRVED